MYRVSSFLGFGILAIALAVGVGTSGETKKDKEKYKGQLPTNWKNIKDLSKDQIGKIQGIDADYRGKIHDLEEKIKDLKIKRVIDQRKILTQDQKDHLRMIVTGEETKEKDKGKGKEKDKDK